MIRPNLLFRRWPELLASIALLMLAALTVAYAAETPVKTPPVAPPPAAQAAPPTIDPDAAVQDAIAEPAPLLRAQILLERAHFSPGQIDGHNGVSTRRAIAGFQRHRGLAESSELDVATWAALDTDTAATLVKYTVGAADIAGPFLPVPDDMMEKAKLPALGYADAAEALGEKFRASPELLRRLNPGKALDRPGVELVVPNVAAIAGPAKAAKVVVDKSDSTVALLDAQGQVYAQYPASTGSEHDPLPIGEWTVKGIAADPVFHYNPELFWDADPAHAKAKIPAGPNNPVGVAWIDLSKEHYGIHGTPEPVQVAKAQSHGCIRLTNWSVREVAQAVAPGTPALLQE